MARTHKTEGTYIDPLCDTGFKILFGRESSEDILIGFLNSILDKDGRDPIVGLTYIDKEMNMESPDERNIFYDLQCKTQSGHRFIVEMQKRPQSHFKERSIFYVSRAITEQGKQGDWEYNFMPVYFIALTMFRIDPEDTRVRVDAMLQDTETNETFSESMRLIYIQLPNFTIENPADCKTDFERWIFILKNLKDMERMPFAQEVFKRVERVARVENLSQEERRRYERDLKFTRDYYSTMKYAEREGLAQGMAQGIAQGMAQGKAEGEALAEERLIRAMASNGLDAATIAGATNLPIDRVRKILG